MNFNEIGLKDLVLDFDSNDLQDITIVQGDTKTRGFKVLVSTNNGEIIKASSQYEMRLYGVNSNYPDKSFFTKGTIDGDFYKVYISTDMASKSGKLQLQLALFEGTNALIQSRIKEVDVYASIANGGNVGKDLVVDFGKLENALNRADEQSKRFEESLVRQQAVESQIAEKHTEVVQIRDGLKDVLTTENARVEAEKKRVSAEDVRATNESTRQSNEATRQSNETARQQNESTRTSNETQRQAEESTRKSDEQERITAETNRNSEETKRDNAEKIRIDNENKRISAENKRAENDSTYNKNEEQRQSQESTRQTQEQQRVEAEKQRQSQEDTRVSQESTRQSQEQSRVDAESKRKTSEATREQSEETRNTKETERQSNESTRQSNEQTRVSQETARAEAEKQRATAESDRAGKFAGWDKTMQGVIPTATSTVAGIVRIDVDGETVAASLKTADELDKAYTELLFRCDEIDSKITDLKIEKVDNTDYASFKDTVTNNITALNGKIQTMPTQNDLDNKADKKHTHTTADITDLQTKLDEKAEKKYVDDKISDVKNSVDLAEETAGELINAIDYLTEWRNYEFLPANKQKNEKPTLEYNTKLVNRIFTLKSGDNKLHYTNLSDFDKDIDFLLLRFKDGEYEFVDDFRSTFIDLYDFDDFGKDNISAIERLGLCSARCREVKMKSVENYTEYTFEVEFIDELKIKKEGYDKASVDSVAELEKKVGNIQTKFPRLKIGEDTSKIPNDSYYIETDEIELKKYLSEEKMIVLEDEGVGRGIIKDLVDLKGVKLIKKVDDYNENNNCSTPNFRDTGFFDLFNQLFKDGKDYSNYLIILSFYDADIPEITKNFELIKKITGSRKIISPFDQEFKRHITNESYERIYGMAINEMNKGTPEKIANYTKLLRGGDVLKYKDKNGKIH